LINLVSKFFNSTVWYWLGTPKNN